MHEDISAVPPRSRSLPPVALRGRGLRLVAAVWLQWLKHRWWRWGPMALNRQAVTAGGRRRAVGYYVAAVVASLSWESMAQLASSAICVWFTRV